jgi:hypothetical protein
MAGEVEVVYAYPHAVSKVQGARVRGWYLVAVRSGDQDVAVRGPFASCREAERRIDETEKQYVARRKVAPVPLLAR